MLKILKQPYPFPEKTFFRLSLQSVGEGLFIAFFLVLFQPFGSFLWHDPNKTLYLCGYGLITVLGGIFLRFGIFRAFPRYHNEASWNIGKEILSIMMLLLLITVGNYFYSIIILHLKQDWRNFLWMFGTVIILGIFPTVFGVMLNYIYQLKKYKQTIIVSHNQNIDNQSVTYEKTLKLIAENEKDIIEISPESLFYIESADNYSTIFYENLPDKKLQKELIRSSLSRLENQIPVQNIVRCHRSYIVNLDKVAKVTGNAQGYKLLMESYELSVPVARKYSELIERLK
jgi:hypothetical protein